MAEQLAHVVRGASRDSVLLLIHPLGAELGFWEACCAVWDGQVTTVACDLRSAGRSPRATAPVTIARHVADLEALREALGLQTLIPVGCAIGAMVAASYAASHPERVPALALSNPGLRTTAQAAAMLQERAALVRADGMAAILPGAVERAFLEQPRDRRYERYYAQFAAQDAEAYALSCLGLLDADIGPDLAAIRCPTLVVAGGHDVLLPPEQARAVHGAIDRAELVLLDDAAHFIPYQQPERFARLVLEFLGRALARPTAPA